MTEDIDAELAKIEEEIKAYEENPTSVSSPLTTQKEKDNIFIFARELIKSKDTRKFGFLDQKYVGIPKMPINSYLEIANYCEVEEMKDLGTIFRTEAENILSTSLSIQGFLLKLLVTQIKREQKVPTTNSTQKKSFWNMGKKQEEVNQNE